MFQKHFQDREHCNWYPPLGYSYSQLCFHRSIGYIMDRGISSQEHRGRADTTYSEYSTPL